MAGAILILLGLLILSALARERLAISKPRAKAPATGGGWSNPGVFSSRLPNKLHLASIDEDQRLPSLGQPLALAAADFDGDGVADLVAGYDGVIAIWRGNIDAIYPNNPAQLRKSKGEYSDAPFLSPAVLVPVPVRPDFIGTGSFDGDGHQGIVFAARGGTALYFLPQQSDKSDKLQLIQGSGDNPKSIGHGGHVFDREALNRGAGIAFDAVRSIDLPGAVTAMTTGEIDRADGLPDIVVGVDGRNGPQVFVFESPLGAMKATPEVFNLPVPATSLALGQLDDSYVMDLAIAAGNNVLIVHGRDRKLSLDHKAQASVGPAAIDRVQLASPVKSIAVGHFEPGNHTQLAALLEDGTIQLLRYENGWSAQPLTARGVKGGAVLSPARISGNNVDDLLVSDGTRIYLLTNESVRPQPDKNPGRTTQNPQFNISQIVTNIRENSSASLRTSVIDVAGVEGESAAQTLSLFSESASIATGERTVAMQPMRLNHAALSGLAILSQNQTAPAILMNRPSAIFTVTNTNDSGAGSLRQAILNANSNPGADGIDFNIPGGDPGCHDVGLDHICTISPASALPIVTDTVTIDGTTQPGFGTNDLLPLIELNGTSAGSANGLIIRAPSSSVIALTINRFGLVGLLLTTGAGSSANNSIVEDCLLGLDVTGQTAQGNAFGLVLNASNTTIGGTGNFAFCDISGNSATGMQIGGGNITVSGNLILGNHIGTNDGGTVAVPNGQSGIVVTDNAMNNTIGQADPNAFSNTISGNGGTGLIALLSNSARPAPSGNLIQSNLIGTDIFGDNLPNSTSSGSGGALLQDSPNNTIGGAATNHAATNIIAGNIDGFGIGLVIQNGMTTNGATGNLVQGNFMGLEILGNLRGNLQGILISGASGNTIGGTAGTSLQAGGCTGACNYIVFQEGDGVQMNANVSNVPSSNNIVQGDIMADSGGRGLLIAPGSFSNKIGGTDPHAANLIAGNTGFPGGIDIEGNGTTGNVVQGNYIGVIPPDSTPLGNARADIEFGFYNCCPSGNTIGGTEPGAGNIIAYGDLNFSALYGVVVDDGTGNVILGNSIYCNNTGISSNGSVPALTSANSVGGSTTIQGTLAATPNTMFRIEFFANNPSGPCARQLPGLPLHGLHKRHHRRQWQRHHRCRGFRKFRRLANQRDGNGHRWKYVSLLSVRPGHWANTNTDSYCDSHVYLDSDINRYRDSHSDRDSYGQPNGNCNCDSFPDANAYANSYSYIYPDANAHC